MTKKEARARRTTLTCDDCRYMEKAPKFMRTSTGARVMWCRRESGATTRSAMCDAFEGDGVEGTISNWLKLYRGPERP
jgi:hypothetical protein